MNYGIYFSEELQKQGARAIPTSSVLEELFKRKNYKAISLGLTPRNVSLMDEAYASAAKYGPKQRGNIIRSAKDDLNGYVADLRGRAIPFADARALENASRRMYYNKSDILGGHVKADDALLASYKHDTQAIKSAIERMKLAGL